METMDTKILINQFFDNELDKDKESYLFTKLADDYESREYFKAMNVLKNTMKTTVEEFPFELEKRILHSIAAKNQKRLPEFKKFSFSNNLFNYVTFSAISILILLFTSLYYFSLNAQYEVYYTKIMNYSKMKDKTIEDYKKLVSEREWQLNFLNKYGTAPEATIVSNKDEEIDKPNGVD